MYVHGRSRVSATTLGALVGEPPAQGLPSSRGIPPALKTTIVVVARVSHALQRDAATSGAPVRLSQRGAPIGTIVIVTTLILSFSVGERLAGTAVQGPTVEELV